MKPILQAITLIVALHSQGAVKEVVHPKDSIKQESATLIHYNYDHPSKTYLLPKELKEISGISLISENELACVEDEKGILYIYDLRMGEVRETIQFGPEGDYEDVAIQDEHAYILRSDGEIYHIAHLLSAERTIEHYASGLPAQDNEGMVYDSIYGGLLIACKGKFGKGLVNQLRREIYVFNPLTKKAEQDYLFAINIDSCASFAHEKGIDLPTKVKNDSVVEILKIRMSAIAIHPETRDYYILSAFDHAVLIFGEKGELKDLQFLNKELFPKAEGIAFLPNGDLLISNEGDGTNQNIQHLKPL